MSNLFLAICLALLLAAPLCWILDDELFGATAPAAGAAVTLATN